MFLFSPAASFGDESASPSATNSQSQALKPPTSGRSGSQALANVWTRIDYNVFKPGEDWSGVPIFLIESGKEWGQVSRGLRLDILNIAQGFAFFKTNAIAARIHRANGDIIELTAMWKKTLNTPLAVGSSYPGEEPNPQVMAYFPWGSNALADCWIEVSIPPERYWLEVPYGFDRNPADPPPPAMPGGPARFSAAMKSLTEHDHVVRWETVLYDLGKTEDGCELSLIQSNPFSAKSEVGFYTDHGKRDLFSPRTAVHVQDANGTAIDGGCIDLHLDDSYLRRTDTFNEIGYSEKDLRCWREIEVTVGDRKYQAGVPSSLYKYTHGRAYQPASIDFRAHLRVGMKATEADRLSKNYNGVRSAEVSSARPNRYQYVFKADASEAALQFDESERLVSWK